eukprot:5040930-Pyramimonas_sp.AAC.1
MEAIQAEFCDLQKEPATARRKDHYDDLHGPTTAAAHAGVLPYGECTGSYMQRAFIKSCKEWPRSRGQRIPRGLSR